MELQDVRQEAEDEHTAERTGEAATTSHEACAANHNRRDGIELQACSRIRLALPVLGNEQNRSDARQHPGNGVGDDLDATDIDARKARCLLIATDRINVAAERRE